MKIGILTLPLHVNYGGILQAYALLTVLKRMGHEVVLINEVPNFSISWKKIIFVYLKRILIRFILRDKNTIIFQEQKNRANYKKNSLYIKPFIDSFVIPRKDVYSLKELKEKDFDVLLVGSDQIWRPMYYKKIQNAFLAFAKNWNVKRISYAASFGTEHWEYSDAQTSKCSSLINLFSAISVRESSGVNLCSKYFHKEAMLVLDPTMLLAVDDYLSLVNDKLVDIQFSGTLLSYILDENSEIINMINFMSKEYDYIPFVVDVRKYNILAVDLSYEFLVPSVENWILGFSKAQFVITDSFHACVFSILFNTPFVVYGNKKRGLTRILSLLSMFGLENRLIISLRDLEKALSTPINWAAVNLKIQEMKKYSFSFLTDSL